MNHDYRDYSQVTKEFEESQFTNDPQHEPTFPVKLHYLLSELEKDGLEAIVGWQVHGRCFVVRDQARFAKEILPMWFRQSKYQSFQRQLNLYSFKRISAGPDKGAYYHELFLRGKRFLSYGIERKRVKGNGARKPSCPEKEPNFYSMPFCSPKSGPSSDKKGQNQAPKSLSMTGQTMPASTMGICPSSQGQRPVGELDNQTQRLLDASANSGRNDFQGRATPNMGGVFSPALLDSGKLQRALRIIAHEDQQRREQVAQAEYLLRTRQGVPANTASVVPQMTVAASATSAANQHDLLIKYASIRSLLGRF